MLVSFSSGAHDCAFSLFENGLPLTLVELERHNRIKECSGAEYDIVDFYNNFDLQDKRPIDRYLSFEMHWRGGIKTMWRQSVERLGNDILFIPHHTAHAAHAFYSSNFDNALIFSIDGGGTEEGVDSAFCVFLGSGNKLERLERIPMESLNIGRVWNGLSRDFVPNGVGNQSGTLMAMAAFGTVKDSLVAFFLEYFVDERKVNRLSVISKFHSQNDLAASLQFATESYIRDKVNFWVEKTNIRNLCFVGGVALNSSMTGKFVMDDFSVYIPPVPYDSGLALGCSQYYWHHSLGYPRVNWSDCVTPYLGQAYRISDKQKNQGKRVEDKDIVELLAQNKIVAVYGGRSECGRRALGNRSILASPLSKGMKDLINQKVKHRQSFRPFAPAILDEKVDDYFEKRVWSPYMGFCIPFKKRAISEVPAVIHEDGTGRLQTVTGKTNPWFHNLLSEFENKTGCPVLLNTSFNDREPIVETPEHAISCFERTDIDYLYFRDEGILIEK